MSPPVKSFIKVILSSSMAPTKTRKMKKIIMVVPRSGWTTMSPPRATVINVGMNRSFKVYWFVIFPDSKYLAKAMMSDTLANSET